MVAIAAGMVALEATTWGCQRPLSSPVSPNPLRPDHQAITFEQLEQRVQDINAGLPAGLPRREGPFED